MLVALLAWTALIGCCKWQSDVVHSIDVPPRASDAVKQELRSLEGTETCKESRDFLIEEIAPYLESIRAAME